MINDNYDVVIIGAGPAGSTLARLISKKHSVLILDRRDLTVEGEGTGFTKCCGGLLAPDAQRMLSVMNLGVPAWTLIGPQIFSVKTIDFDNNQECFYQRHYINIDREKFDRWLVSEIPGNVKTEFGSRFKNADTSGETYTVTYSRNGVENTVKAGIIVGADGAFSKVRRQVFPFAPQPDQYISIQEWYKLDDKMSSFFAVFDREVSDFYSWIIPEGDLFLLGTAVRPGKNAVDKFQLLKSRLEIKGFKFGDPVKKSGAFLLRPQKLNQIFTGRKNVLLIGEAAGFISPSSAEGISYAFRSAIALADVLNNSKSGYAEKYRKKTRSLRFNIFLKNVKSPFMYWKIIRGIILRMGVMSIRPMKND